MVRQKTSGSRHGKRFWEEEKESFGFKALAKLGWKPGEGIGSDKQGRNHCVGFQKKNDNIGIGGKHTNVAKHRAIVSMYNDVLKKAGLKKGHKKKKALRDLSIDEYVVKNALYKNFHLAKSNEFRITTETIEEATITFSKSKKKKKKKKKADPNTGFTLEYQENFALNQKSLAIKGKKGLGFGKAKDKQIKPTWARTESQPETDSSLKKKKKKSKKKKKKKIDEVSDATISVTETTVESTKTKKKKKKTCAKTTIVIETSTTELTNESNSERKKKKKKKKKKRKREEASENPQPAKKQKIEPTPTETTPTETKPQKKKKKKKKKKETALIETSTLKTAEVDLNNAVTSASEVGNKKKKKSKKQKKKKKVC